MTEIRVPFEAFRDTDGTPLDAGYVYIGIEHQEPITHPANVFWDADLTIAASQPIRTLGGYPVRAGAPAKVYASGGYSICVKNKNREIVTYAVSSGSLEALLADATSPSRGAGMIGYGSGVTYPAGTIGDALASIPSAYVTYAADQAQTYRAFTASGAAPVFTLTPSPAVTALAEPLEFEVKFSANGTTGSNTLNVSALGAVALKQYDSTGTLVDGVVKSGQIAKVRYNGTYWVILNPLPATAASGNAGYSDFKASCTGTSAVVTMTSARVTVRNAAGASIELSNVSKTLTMTATGAGGMDAAESLAASTWYYIYFIYNPTTGVSNTLASLSPNSPTLPSGYTHYRRMGAVRTDATANKYPLAGTQRDNAWAYTQVGNVTEYPRISGGNTSGAVACSLSSVVPPTASEISIAAFADVSGAVAVQPFTTVQGRLWVHGGTTGEAQWARIPLQATSLYVEASGSSNNFVGCTGYVDNGGPIYVEA